MGKGDLERGAPTKSLSQLVKNRLAVAYGVDAKWKARLVPLLVVVNVVLFYLTLFVNNCPQHHSGDGDCVAKFLGRLSFEPVDDNVFFGPSSDTLEKLGGLQWNKIVNQNESWRLVSNIFLHAGVIHLLANMLILVPFGILLEQQYGFMRVGVIYMLSGLGGSIVSSLLIRKTISVGASGAIFGLMGALISGLLTNWTIHLNHLRALLSLLTISGMFLPNQSLPQVNNFTHIGGFLTGLLLGFILLVRPQSGWSEQRHDVLSGARLKSKYAAYQYVLCILATILLFVGFTMGWVMLFRGDDGVDKGSWCMYISFFGIAVFGVSQMLKTYLYE